jgi:hypothetical protein
MERRESILSPDGIIRTRSGAFENCRELTSISFPQSFSLIGNYGYNCKRLKDITVSGLNTKYYNIDGVLFDKEIKKVILSWNIQKTSAKQIMLFPTEHFILLRGHFADVNAWPA